MSANSIFKCSSRRQSALTLFSLLATTLLMASCATKHSAPPSEAAARAEEKVRLNQTLQPVYGQPIPRRIQVYVYGAQVKNPGLYYFKTGTTLVTALLAVQTDDFASELTVYNLDDSEIPKRKYHFKALTGSEKGRVLHEDDCLFFPTAE